MKKFKDWYLNKFKTGNLAKKTSFSIGTVVILCMLVLIAITAVLSSNFLSKSIKAEFSQIAGKNSVTVQSIIDTTSNTADSLQTFIESEYEAYAKNGYSGETEKSALYDVKLQRMNKEIENYMRKSQE